MMPNASVHDSLREGFAHHQAGRLQQAEQVYRGVLAIDQTCALAWHLLGTLAHQTGHSDAAAQMIERAIRLGLKESDVFNTLGECYRVLGKPQEAESAYQSSLRMNPDHVETLNNLGMLLNSMGRFNESMPPLEKALTLRPDFAAAHYNYGVTLMGLQRSEDAVREWRAALALQPNLLPALKDLGLILHRHRQVDEALSLLKKLVDLYPDFPDGHADYAEVLSAAERPQEAVAEAQLAIRLQPNNPELHNTLGIIYYRAGLYEEALGALKKALEIEPTFAPAMDNIGNVYNKLERYSDAAAWFEKALQIDPMNLSTSKGLFGAYYKANRADEALRVADLVLQREPNHPRVHYDRGMLLLSLGRYAEGFEEYEWRARCREFHYLSRNYTQPLWNGDDRRGQMMYVYGEQGFGDILQFARYIPMVLERGIKITYEVSAPLFPLMKCIPGISELVLFGSQLPQFDVHVPLLSLPRIFKTTVETIPQQIPYLFTDPKRVDLWRPIIAEHARGLKVGIVWAGNQRTDPKRSCSLKQLSRLAQVPGISWYSLQADEHREQLKDVRGEMEIVDLGSTIKDFADTAAAMTQMDLIITIDTASAHLAGALGKTTWAMIPFVPDWRWFRKGNSSPWYPSMQLFRQEVVNDWTSTIDAISRELQQYATAHQQT